MDLMVTTGWWKNKWHFIAVPMCQQQGIEADCFCCRFPRDRLGLVFVFLSFI